VAEELKAVFDPRGGHWVQGHYVPSLLAAIGEVIEQHLVDIGFMRGKELPDYVEEKRMAVNDDGSQPRMASCPKCGAPSLIRQEGCDTCISCGYSKCG
jgi:ribonucleoside-diphosphate reductase alpha chain